MDFAGLFFTVANGVSGDLRNTKLKITGTQFTHGFSKRTAFSFSATTIDKYLRKTDGSVVESAVGLDPSKSPFDQDGDYRVLLPA